MKKYFIVKTHEDSGALGFLEKTAPANFEPFSGMGTAHDCLEHFPGDDGSIDHEFQALGCCLWIRGNGGYPYNNGSVEKNTASDIAYQLWRLFHFENYPLKGPKSTGRLVINNLVEETVNISRKDIIDEANSVGDDPINEDQLEEFLNSARYWMQVGYNKGRKRYPDAGMACYVFQKIEKAVNSKLRNAFEYQEFSIQYSLKTGHVEVEELILNDF